MTRGDDLPDLTADAQDADTKTKSGGGLKILAGFALAIAITAAGGAIYLSQELEDLKKDNQQLSARVFTAINETNSYLGNRVGDLEDEIGGTYSFRSLADRVGDLEDDVGETYSYMSLADRVDDLEDDIKDLQQDVSRLNSDDWDIIISIDDLTACVNEYMKIVADAGGGRYQFYFC
jgi:hypothetical protein